MIAIKKIQIYGFGKHENLTIHLQDSVTIFYGANEAGKTTIQQFILQILFGFPTKQQVLQKYEPKTSTKFGGQLTIEHPKYGTCIIERVKGKAAGDVTVYLADGTTGHDDLLAKIVYGYSRTAFEAIFAFSIHELQGIEKMSEEELTHLLLASGTTGVNQLTALEKRLDKDAGELFKKSGKIPAINMKIEQLKTLEKTIQQERMKIEVFEEMLVELAQIELALQQHSEDQAKLQEDWQRLTIQRQAQPLLEQQVSLQHALKDRQQQHFPVEGIRRYEQLKDKLTNEQLQFTQLQEKSVAIKSQITLSGDAMKTEELLKYVQRESEWNQFLVKEQKLTEELFVLEQEMEGQFRLLGIQDEEQKSAILKENVSLQQEQQFQEPLLELQEAEAQLQFHLHSLEQNREELEHNTIRQQQLKQDFLSVEEERIVAEWPYKKQRLERLRQTSQSRMQQKQPTIFILISIVISLVAVFFGVAQKNWAVAALGVVITIFLVVFLQHFMKDKLRNGKGSSSNTGELRGLEQLEISVTALLEKQRRHQERAFILAEQQQEKERQYGKLERQIQQLEQQIIAAEAILQRFLHRFHITGEVAKKLIPELFTRIRTVQECALNRNSKRQLLQDVLQQKQELLQAIETLLQQTYSEQELFVHLRKAYNDNQKLQLEEQSLVENLTLIMKETEEKQPLIDNLKLQIEQLFIEAEVAQEAAFYEAFSHYEREEKWAQQLKFISSQLASLGAKSKQTPLQNHNFPKLQAELEQKQSDLQNLVDSLLQRRATLKLQQEHLLTDEKYGELLQSFEDEKTSLQQLILEWSAKRAVSESIHRTLHILREQKLPHVLNLVNTIFHRLTDGKYDKLFINSEGIFEAQSVTSMRYRVAELSQATKEQAYIALRIALAKTLIESAPFPFIMDDPFVHFDRNRTSNMVQLMKEVGYEHQILYFTCHDAMLANWQQEQIVDIGVLANERK
ncbi:MAG: AAA family ATPase [Lysinibacillus sp.]